MAVAEIRLMTDDELDERRTVSYWNHQWDLAMPMAKKRKKRQPVDGLESLRRAADRRLRKNMKKLADAMTEKAMAGDLGSLKLLVALAEAKKPEVETRKLPSLALWLAAHPEYEEERAMAQRRNARREARQAEWNSQHKEWWEEGYVGPEGEDGEGEQSEQEVTSPSDQSVNRAGNPPQP
jgi:hypothetical protein